MSNETENVYTDLTYTEIGEAVGEGTLPLVRNESTQVQDYHDQASAVLKFFERHSRDLKRILPIGAMIERMHSLGVITLEERASLERKRDLEHETDETLAVGVFLLIESSGKSSEQLLAFLRAIEETRADGLTTAIRRDIWTLLQSSQARAPSSHNSSSVYQPLSSNQPTMVYQHLLPTGTDDPIGKKQRKHTTLNPIPQRLLFGFEGHNGSLLAPAA